MIRIEQLKLNPDHSESDLVKKICKRMHLSEREMIAFQIKKQSIDARKKTDIKYVYTVDVQVKNEMKILKHLKGNQGKLVDEKPYVFPAEGTIALKHRPVIVGSGPAGLFCAYMLAKYGYRPIVLERGASVLERVKDIESFWETGVLNTKSNVQFGEGGAGTFSDGKLNTLVKDPFGRNQKVLEIFVENGAPKEILYINKPHIGTDILINVVKNMRNHITEWGGEVRFHAQMVDYELKGDSLSTVQIQTTQGTESLSANVMVLAIGHSARDTFELLHQKQIGLTAKPFAVGVRVEHLQKWINESQYGADCPYELPTAAYKVATTLENGRGVYSFCMCPGGYVVNASSEEGMLAVNGMSYHARSGENANSAIIVTVTPKDFGTEHPLSGMYFQRDLERKAYLAGNGKIPVQRFEDFCKKIPSDHVGIVKPQQKGQHEFANVRAIFPTDIGDAIEEGIKSFDKQIQQFANPDTLISGVESRTSSPIKIPRNEELMIENTGIYPCGEGAGYAGGITSAAMDGLKIAEIIRKKYLPFD